MIRIRPLAETNETVTLARRDFEVLLAAAGVSSEPARPPPPPPPPAPAPPDSPPAAEALPVILAARLRDGEHPIRVWREHRGYNLLALSELAGVSVHELADIEEGQRPGRAIELHAIAAALRVPVAALR